MKRGVSIFPKIIKRIGYLFLFIYTFLLVTMTLTRRKREAPAIGGQLTRRMYTKQAGGVKDFGQMIILAKI